MSQHQQATNTTYTRRTYDRERKMSSFHIKRTYERTNERTRQTDRNENRSHSSGLRPIDNHHHYILIQVKSIKTHFAFISFQIRLTLTSFGSTMIIHRTASIILRNLISLRQSFPSVSQSTVSSAAIKLNSNMKRLIESQQYRQALDLFNQQFRLANDATITLALKASAHLRSYEHGFHIHQQLSTKSLTNPWIQSSLIHFYSGCNDIHL